MEQELDHPLRPLVERLGRAEVEEADEVDELRESAAALALAPVDDVVAPALSLTV